VDRSGKDLFFNCGLTIGADVSCCEAIGEWLPKLVAVMYSSCHILVMTARRLL
jgi:hypothetical protein